MNTESNDSKMRKKNKKKKEKNKEKKRKSDKSASVVTKKKHSNEVNQSEVFGKTLKMPARKVSEEISQGGPEERVQDVEKVNEKLKENLEVTSKVNERPKKKSKRKPTEQKTENQKKVSFHMKSSNKTYCRTKNAVVESRKRLKPLKNSVQRTSSAIWVLSKDELLRNVWLDSEIDPTKLTLNLTKTR